ncbi:MAG: SLAC1 anion channel family protein [Deltaproteobacteria bacterium]|nr:SLAC1 anion channel family protein [Deltaproteobacteria bacterium]
MSAIDAQLTSKSLTAQPEPAVGVAHWLENFPVTLFGSVMGIIGLGIAGMRFEQILQISIGGAGHTVLYIGTAWFVFLTMVYLLKAARYPHKVREEFAHPVRVNFFPAYSISLLLLSIGFLEINPQLSRILWWVGAPLQLFYTLKILSTWLTRDDLKLAHLNPAWFIPVVGTILVPIAGVKHAHPEISWLFFSAGLIFWIVLFSLMVNRLIFAPSLPKKLLPTLFILIAPPAIGFVAYIKLGGGYDMFARVLFYFGVFTFLLLLTMLPRFRDLPFFVSWWAFTFPLDALTISVLLMYKLSGLEIYRHAALVLLPLTAAVIAMVTLHTLKAAVARKICVAE